ncbi:unnamed protein product [Brassicogethes aeneus]|uniref:3'-5' exonuclease domain-containing protein n=1 Tax=Brassicogethes aeneus TaxID=1431903 RepID=A0A9P0AT49_BRAAE|nr:unnamed protein product [Brassicogethes aeneus]
MYQRRDRGGQNHSNFDEGTKMSYYGRKTSKPDKNISKHDNNCCQDISISLELEDNDSMFFQDLKKMWTMLKNSPPVISKLHNYYNACYNLNINPYVQELKLIFNCQDFYNIKSKTLPLFVIEEFKKWSTISRNKIIHFLTPQVQLDAFKVINLQNSYSVKKMVFECYEFYQSKDLFFNSITCMVERKQYREASYYAMLFKFHDKFTIDDFLIPLVLQDKLCGVVDEFLEGSKKHQVDLVQWCDSILAKNVNHAAMEYVCLKGIADVKLEKLYAKPWKKLIARLVKTYRLPSDLTPNLVKKRNEGALQFILHKRFIERAFSDDSYREMVQEAVGDDEEMKKELVSQVATYQELSEALRWAHFYNIEKEAWPYGLRIYEENPNEDRHQLDILKPEEETWDLEPAPNENADYHKFRLDFNSIRLIDSEETFHSFLDTGLQDVDIVGIDCEWKPSFGNKTNELALMQIATRKFVFILDVINLSDKVPPLWQELGKLLFNNSGIVKLGFSFSSDYAMIKQTLPLLNFSTKQVGFLDLHSIWKQLEKHSRIKLPYEVRIGGPSLGTLVHHCLGRPLDKSDQFSNWEKRPLRESQLIYAALDAYVLIEIYDVMKQCTESAKLNFDDICYHLMTNDKTQKKKTKNQGRRKFTNSTAPTVPQAPSPHPAAVPAHQVKVVCDTMLQGLAKNLRRVGIDAAVLQNHQEHQECVKYAINEKRYILSRGGVYNMLSGYVPQGHCLKILSDDVDEQLKEVLDYYKIIVTRDHIFSRCQACNGNSFIKVSRSTMSALVNSARSVHHPPPCYEEDEATGFTSEEELEEAGYSYRKQPYVAPPAPITTSRKWDLYPDEKLDMGLCQTKQGAKIQVSNIPEGVLNKNELYYVCEECGKVFWDGTHFEKVLQGRLKDVVQ